MALEFEKITTQVTALGQQLATHTNTVTERLLHAGEFLMSLTDMDLVWDQIMLARRTDAGFRGAAPTEELINKAFPLPACPPKATILASDGSQIYPDTHGAVLYWLTNIGVFTYFHGENEVPYCITEPNLFYDTKDVRDPDGRPISNAAINARRTVFEMQLLARETLNYTQRERPLVALYDGPLLSMLMGKDVPNSSGLLADYHEALTIIQNAGGITAGYVDRPGSRFVIYLLYLMTLEPDAVRRGALNTTGEWESLNDADIFKVLLRAGERSAIMVQQSPSNKEYRETYGDDHEIAFFYINVAGRSQEPYLARVEIPVWVAAHPAMIDGLHALVYDQCQITDRYPYVLTRADEIAVVQPHEKRALDEMIAVELLKNQQQLEMSQKLSTKGMARSVRQSFRGV